MDDKNTQLYLKISNVNNLEFLKDYTHIESLEITRSISINDYSPIKNLVKLKYLSCKGCRIKDISFLKYLPNLISLNLANNNMVDLTPLGNLKSLQILNLEQCYQARNHGVLARLTKLTSLDVRVNQIEDVEDFIKVVFHEYMSELYLSPSPINWKKENIHNLIPKELFGKSGDNLIYKLKAFFREYKKGNRKNQSVKIVVIGNGSVGKTQISRRLCFEEKFIFNTVHDSTHGIVLIQKKISDLVATFWDFAGQDIYHSTHRIFMQTRALFLLIWDIENENKLFHTHNGKKYRNEKIVYWLEYAKFLGRNNSVLVVQNKVDNEEDKGKKYLSRTIDKFKFHYSVSEFIQVSAKTGYNFDILEYWIYESFRLNYSFKRELLQKLPNSWINTRERIFAMQREGTKTISIEDFDEFCKLNGINEQIEVLLNFLHNSGVIFYQESYFSNTIVLDQAWAIDAIYKVLDRENFYYRTGKVKKGNLVDSDFLNLWKDFSRAEIHLFLSIMLKTELCFIASDLDEKNKSENSEKVNEGKPKNYIIPQLLPEIKPEEIEFWENEKGITKFTERLSFKFLPALFIHRFIVRANKIFKIEFMWQSGILIKYNDEYSIVEADYVSKEIIIKYNREKIYELILKELYDITNRSTTVFRKLKMISEEMFYNDKFFRHILKDKEVSVKEEAKQKIYQGKLEQAISIITNYASNNENKDLESESIFLSCRLQLIENQIRTGTVSNDNANLEKNKIITSIIQIIDSI